MNGLEKYEKILKQSCLFRQKDAEELQELGRLLGGKIQDYGKGQQLLHEGDTIGQLGIVLEGEVRIVRIDMDGNERLFQKLIPSYMLGADIVCTPSRQSPYSAYCSQDTKVWFFDWMPGHEKWEEELERRLMEFIANENVRKFYRIDILSTKSVRRRVLKYLRIHSAKGDRDARLTESLPPLPFGTVGAGVSSYNKQVRKQTVKIYKKQGRNTAVSVKMAEKNHI